MNCHQHLYRDTPVELVTRRHFFEQCGIGVGKIALSTLLTGAAARASSAAGAAAGDPMAPKAPHFPAKAKRVIHLFMAGAPSQLDLFDYKPKLDRARGQAAFRRRSSAGSGMHSSAPTRPCWARVSSLPGTASRARSSRRCCPTWPKWSTTSA